MVWLKSSSKPSKMINQFFGKALLRRLSTHTAKRKGSHLKLRERRLFDNLRALSEGPNQQVRLPTVSLVGLPNVGKSTLYNRLTRQDRRRRGARAIVASTPQTTRDFRESTARIGDMHFNLVDTGGLETGSKQQRHSGGGGPNTFGSHAGLEQPMLKLTTSVVRRSDVVFLMLDGKHGISVLDDHFARWLRKIKTELPSERNGKRVIYPVINKIEGLSEDAPEFQTLLADAHRLGFGEPLYISAEQGHGFADLFQAISKATEDPTNNTTTHENNAPGQTNNTPSKGKGKGKDKNKNSANGDTERPVQATIEVDVEVEDVLQLAIVGRPNVGKSTLLNQLVGEERVLTGPTPGLTRDPIRIDMRLEHETEDDQPRVLRIIDTAGIRRPGKRDTSSTIETESVAESIHALQYSHVVAVMIDASAPPTRMDMALVGQVLDEGRALVIVANKTDTMKGSGEHSETMKAYLNHTESNNSKKFSKPSRKSLDASQELGSAVLDHLAQSIPQIKGAPVVPMSALQGEGVEALVPAAMEAYRRWDRRITTGTLNQWIAAVQRHTPPPRGATIKFGSQVSNRPPKFLFFSNGTQQVPEHYIRFLSKSLRDEFDMGGVPLRVKVVPKEKRGSTKKRSQRKGKGSAR